MPETWPSASHSKQLQEGMQQNTRQNYSLYCVQRCCATFLIRTLSCSIKEKCSCKLNHAQCNLSKCTAKVVSVEPSCTYVYKELGSGVPSDIFVTWDGATLKFESSSLIAEKAKLC